METFSEAPKRSFSKTEKNENCYDVFVGKIIVFDLEKLTYRFANENKYKDF